MNSCPFCSNEIMLRKIAENNSAIAIYDKYPVNEGHALIIPKRHVSNYFDLDKEEQSDCWQLLNEVKDNVDSIYQPQGYNVGINIGEVSGQTVMHVHIHCIPRYTGDQIDPRGGVRGVIPEKKLY